MRPTTGVTNPSFLSSHTVKFIKQFQLWLKSSKSFTAALFPISCWERLCSALLIKPTPHYLLNESRQGQIKSTQGTTPTGITVEVLTGDPFKPVIDPAFQCSVVRINMLHGTRILVLFDLLSSTAFLGQTLNGQRLCQVVLAHPHRQTSLPLNVSHL